MENEFNKWAEVYDLIYSDKSEKDIEFYLKKAKKAKGKVLEVGCGTGRIYINLLKAGVDAYGVDISEEMLKVLKHKARKLDLKPKVKKADMKNFKLDNNFSLIIVPFRTFLHNLKIEDQINSLKNFKKHLKPEGKLILNFFPPDVEYIAENYGKVDEKEIKRKEGTFILKNKTDFVDEVDEVVKINQSLHKNGKVVWEDQFKISLIHKREFELLLQMAGFKDWKVYGDFDQNPLTNTDQEMVWIIKSD